MKQVFKHFLSSVFVLLIMISLQPALAMASDETTYDSPPIAIADPYAEHSYHRALSPLYSIQALQPYEEQKAAILDALLNFKKEIYIPGYTRETVQTLFDLRQQVLDEHPEIFYFTNQGTTWSTNGCLTFNYKYSIAEIQSMQTSLNQKVAGIITETISPNATDLDKELAFHDYLLTHTVYDQANLVKNTIPDLDYTAYGILVNEIGVCEGYAKAMQLLLSQVGIESQLVCSDSMNHAWNLVKIDGQWYHLDVTWDDPVPDQGNKIIYTYFNQSDTTMQQGGTSREKHDWDTSLYPAATSDRFIAFHDMSEAVRAPDYIYYISKLDDIKLYKIRPDGSEKQRLADVRVQYLVLDGEWLYFSNYSRGAYLSKIKTDGSQLTELNTIPSINLRRDNRTLYFNNQESGALLSLDLGPAADIPISAISLDRNALQLYPGSSPVKLTATISPASASSSHLIWTSDMPAVATVSTDGTVSAMASGTAIITASSADGQITANCTVTIKDLPAAPISGDKWSAKYDQPADKPWTITFSHPASGITQQNIYITDARGTRVDANVIPGNDNTQATITPLGSYATGEVYFLCISGELQSLQGRKLSRPVILPFVIKN